MPEIVLAVFIQFDSLRESVWLTFLNILGNGLIFTCVWMLNYFQYSYEDLLCTWQGFYEENLLHNDRYRCQVLIIIDRYEYITYI